MLRLPNNALQNAFFKLLKEKEAIVSTKAYDYVPDDAVLPYITVGNMVTKDTGTKTEDTTQVEMQINIWSNYSGKHQINTIAERLITLLTSMEGHLDAEPDDFYVLRQSINMYEAYPEDTEGYNGVINLEVDVQNLRATSEEI